MIIHQTKYKWYSGREGKDCFKFVIQKDKTTIEIYRLWWWNDGFWMINKTEQNKLLEV